ncbi:DHA2 family efflux MFS transporter permease subunit [Paenibacillus sp. PR3]|uniref:DHA2 family efflux MFS transporter permease subunit n=2 Tax=Paenibacillus terricola TaxID=2763503 RepID=A0ABR8MTQ8_9BACL|nr:DHA2 family efflux MFS transporter permease subunit [Paenibacillus terricola]
MPSSKAATATTKPVKEKLDPQLLKVAIILIFGALASQLDSTMVNVAIDTLTVDLHSTVSAIQWVITGYILTMGLAVPISGWAVSRFGGKRVYLFALGLFLISSILCSVAWNVGSLVGFRLIQGTGAGLLIPTMTTVLVQTAGGKNLGRIISIIGIPALLGPILGPVLGGLIVNDLSWRWIFYVNIPVTLIAMLLAWLIIPKDVLAKAKQKLDVTGLLLLSPAFSILIYSIAQMSQEGGLNSASVLVPLLIGIVLMGAFVGYALRKKQGAILDLHLFRSRHFLSSNITLFLAGMVMNGAMLLLPLFYQQVRGETAFHTGLLLIPQGIGMLLTRTWIGGLSDRIGPRPIVITSLFITIIGTLPFAFADADTHWFLLAAGQLIQGAALNGILLPIMVSAYHGLAREQIPHASVSTRIFQTIGGAFGSSVLATVIASRMSSQSSLTVNTLSGAFQSAFWWAIGLAVVAIIPTLLLAKPKKTEA